MVVCMTKKTGLETVKVYEEVFDMKSFEFLEKFNEASKEVDGQRLHQIVEQCFSDKHIYVGKGSLNLLVCIEEIAELVEQLSLARVGSGTEHDLVQEIADVLICLELLKQYTGTTDMTGIFSFKGYYDYTSAIRNLVCCQQQITKVLRGILPANELKQTICTMYSVVDWMLGFFKLSAEKVNKAVNVKLDRLSQLEEFR